MTNLSNLTIGLIVAGVIAVIGIGIAIYMMSTTDPVTEDNEGF
jgi:hypothetical protein